MKLPTWSGYRLIETALVGTMVTWRSFAGVTEIEIGGARLAIPAPSGFASVTEKMEPYYSQTKKAVPAGTEQLAVFLPESQAGEAASGRIPSADRAFSVRTMKQAIGPVFTTAYFEELKDVIKTQNESIVRKAWDKAPGSLEKLKKMVGDTYDVEANSVNVEILPLAPHYETERCLAFSALVTYYASDETGRKAVYEGVVTATMLHLKGKLPQLICSAERAGLEWSRAASKEWADAVVAANLSSGASEVQEVNSSLIRVISTLGKVLFLVIIVGGLTYVFRRKGA